MRKSQMNHSSRYVIIAGFTVMLLLLLVIIAIGINNMSAANERMATVVNVHNVKALQMSTLRSFARERSLLFYNMILLRDPFVVDENIQKASNIAGEFLAIQEALFATIETPEEKRKLDLMMANVQASIKIQREIIELLSAGKFDQASTLFIEKSLPAQLVAVMHYDSIINDQTQLAETAAKEAQEAYQHSFIFMLILSAIVITVGLAISIITIKRTTRAESALQTLNSQLEQRVEERTHALSEANVNLQDSIQKLQDTKVQLIQSEKMASLGSLVAGISHEVNTPLGIGVTSASSLLEELGNIERQFQSGNMKRSDLENFFEHAHQAGNILINNLDRAANLIRSFKQVAVDQSSNDLRSVNFYNYFGEILLSLHPQYKNTAITVENCADVNLNSVTHPGAIYQILSNIILNALLHAFESGQSGMIRISAKQEGSDVEITCHDNGKGIAEEHIGRIFDPFFTTRRGTGGSGLGLNIVYNLVTTQLGGTITVESAMGKGTTFRIRFPMHLTQEG
jgi:signal transduction histidine kinase